MQSPTDPPSPAPLQGVHISRGVRLRIPAGGLTIHHVSDAIPRMEVSVVELQLDTCVHWLDIALEHLADAHQANQELLVEPAGSPRLGSLLDREFKASVQAAFAAATFFEALYAATMERNPPPKSEGLPGAPKSHTARFAKVTEQLRRSFGLKTEGAANLRAHLREIYRFRDQAVHPAATFTQPVPHPDIGVGVEHRFVMYSAANARQLVRAALAFSIMLSSRNLERQLKDIQDLAAYLLDVSRPLQAHWEQNYGPLFDAPS